MDGNHSVSAAALYARLGTALAPVLVDVRRPDAFDADDRLIVGAFRRSPENISDWCNDLPRDRQVIVYCSQGREVSQGVTAALKSAGLRSGYLVGGISGWKEQGLPTRKKITATSDRWVTREHPKIDRIACPWLIARFINPLAQFIYVPPDQVLAVAQERDATPYDIKGVEFGHVGDRCSFDAIVRIYEIQDPSLDQLAAVVRGADTSRPDLMPQCEGLLAISYGLSSNFPDDYEMLRHGMVMYDALYTWCRAQIEKHPSAVREVSR